MERIDSVTASKRPIPLSLILMTAFAVHVPLLLMQLPLHSYDATLHIFFASHYVHHWFDPWNVKWYAGFSQTTYPPLPQQWVAVLSHIFGLDMAYMVVQFAAILLLALGVYRFSALWVSERAASFAALASVFLGAESFLVYSAGQLSTTSAAPIYLNALPYLFDWIRHGRWRSFLKGAVLFTAAAAAHHATLLFGSMFFALPILALVLLDREDGERIPTSTFLVRTISIVVVVTVAIAAVLLPFWIALIHNPVTQTPIPHASRANYILSPMWGLNYFVIPYGGGGINGNISVADDITGWASRDHCTGAPVTTYDNGDASCITRSGCDGGADVVLCTIDGGGHQWPGGESVGILNGKKSDDLHATEAAWEFFAAHPLAN